MPTDPNDDNDDTDLLYDDIPEDMKLPYTKNLVHGNTNVTPYQNSYCRNTTKNASTNRDTTTGSITDTRASQETVSHDFMRMSTRSTGSFNIGSNHYDTVDDVDHGPAAATMNSIELVPILQDQVRQLQKENSTLKRNIGILYRTAITEIQRKDQQILEQQLQLQQQHR